MGYKKRKIQLEKTFKPREEWWSRVFATPVANLVLSGIADWSFITPNRLTILSFILTILTAVLILSGSSRNLVIAGIVLQLAYIIDCMDGQLARYRQTTSRLGSFSDKLSDYIKFPAVLLALTIDAHYHHTASNFPAILGILSVFFIGYLFYLKSLSLTELSIPTWNVLSGKGFLQRNLRFFLFEEAQWYLIVSLCLFLSSTISALIVIALTQGVLAIVQTIRVFILKKRAAQAVKYADENIDGS